LANQRAFLDALGAQLGVSSGEPSGWYGVSTQAVLEAGGAGLLARYGRSLSAALASVYPEQRWDALRFTHRPRHHWRSLDHQRDFLDSLATRLGHSPAHRDAWYTVTAATVAAHGGAGLLDRYRGSLHALLSSVYPDHPWDALRFAKAPQRYWAAIERQRAFLDGIAQRLGFDARDTRAWYGITARRVAELGGGGLLDRYHDSLAAALEAAYPELPWERAQFSTVPRRHWASLEHQRAFMDALAHLLSFDHRDRWYDVRRDTLLAHGGGGVLGVYGGSLPRLLTAVYPEHEWLPWRFPRRPLEADLADLPVRLLDDLLAYVETALAIADPLDWLRVSTQQLETLGLSRLLQTRRPELRAAITARYPRAAMPEDKLLV